MMSRILTYRLMLMLTLLAGLFLMSSCQEEDSLYDTTEVMMTFTTRALVTQSKESASVDEERMKDLRVIMVRENGMVVHNHKVENINASSVTVTFQTPVKTGGEDFRFFAIANEGSIVPTLDFAGIANTDTATLIHQVVGEGEFSIPQNHGVPQTKYWTKRLRQVEKDTVSKQLDFMVGKISLRFVNHTSEAQSLTDIYIDGITPATQGYLFKQNANDYVGTQYIASARNATENVGTQHDASARNATENVGTRRAVSADDDEMMNQRGAIPSPHCVLVPLPEGQYRGNVGTRRAVSARNATENNARAASGITFNDVTDIAVGDSSAIQHYYTYPIQTISGAALHATWNGVEKTLDLSEITSLARGQHLQIVVTLTGEGMTYAIADWNQDNKTHIGSPTVGSDYDVKDWQGGTDIVIGGGNAGGEEPGGGDEPEPEPDVPVVPGDVIWSKDLNLNVNGSIITHSDDLTETDLSNFKLDYILGVVVEFQTGKDWNGLRILQRGNTWYDLPSAKDLYDTTSSRINISENCTIEFSLAQADLDYIQSGKGVEFWGNGVTITQIYIKAPATQ